MKGHRQVCDATEKLDPLSPGHTRQKNSTEQDFGVGSMHEWKEELYKYSLKSIFHRDPAPSVTIS